MNKLLKNILIITCFLFFINLNYSVYANNNIKNYNTNENYLNIQDDENEVVLYIVRHGETIFNFKHLIQGWSNAPLTSNGVESTKQLGKGFESRGINFKSVYISDLDRTKETAKNILLSLTENNLKLNEDVRLKEGFFGIYEGDISANMLYDIGKEFGYNSSKEFKDSNDYTVENIMNTVAKLDELQLAENYNDIAARTKVALIEIAEENKNLGGGNVLIVSHGVAIDAMISGMTDKAPEKGDYKNAAVTKIVYKNGVFDVQEVNNTDYIEINN